MAICGEFNRKVKQTPLQDIAGEQEKGRTFRIVPADNHATTQTGAILNGTTASAAAFLRVADQADALYATLSDDEKPFFNDNLRQPAHYMYGLNVCLLELTKGYVATDPSAKRDAVKAALAALQGAESALRSTQHGVFSTWYAGDRIFGFQGVRDALSRLSNAP